MIAWSIEAALESECFDEIVVTTEDEKIAEVAKKHGATVPFMRPNRIADDYTGTDAVIGHAVDWFLKQGFIIDSACHIYATAPFVRPSDIHDGLAILQTSGCDYVLPVASYLSPIQRAIGINSTGRIEMFYPEHYNSRSQDLKNAFFDAGQFCWGRPKAWSEKKPVFLADTIPIHLPLHIVKDIDTPEDWHNAELMFKVLQK